MKYSYNWLQSHIEDPMPSAEVLKETIIFHAFEVEDVEVTPIDTIFDIKVLPDRAGDCLSHYGMAREIAGLLDLNFNDAVYTLPATATEVSIDVETNNCLRYSAVRLDGVHVGPSPDWLVKKLAAVGQRSINNVVDITNFILLDLGQPTHVFDADKIHGSIVVRAVGPQEETITTLSGEEKVLKEGMMVIADSEKVLAIAGVKGGTAAEVTNTTTSIILEIANFDAATVRKTARALNLVTDAAKRFENNLAPYMVEPARAKLVGMITLLAGGTVVAVGDYYPHPQQERAISFTLDDIQQSLGTTVTDQGIVTVLDRYGYSYEKTNDFYTVAVPRWRHDITGTHDMIEEFGRVIGYDTIPNAPLPFTPTPIANTQYEKIRAIKYSLIAQGYSELMTYSFRKKGDVSVAYGPKDKSALRNNLSDALKESYEMNKLNAPLLGVSEVKIFEIGTVFTNDSEQINIALADKGGVKEWSVDEYVLPSEMKAVPEAAESGVAYGNTAATAPFKPWSPYPFITRDIAVWLSDESSQKELEKTIADFAAAHCIRPALMFDTFTKDDKTSVAYRLVFQSMEKTLTDTEVEPLMQTLNATIAAHIGMTIR